MNAKINDKSTVKQEHNIQFTVLTSCKTLTKRISIGASGKMVKSAQDMGVDKAEKITLPSLKAVINHFDQLTDHQAVCWGVYTSGDAFHPVDLKDKVKAGLTPAGTISRSQDHFAWSNSAGVMMFDIDCEHSPEQARNDLVAAYKVAFGKDELSKVEMVYKPSAGAGCYTLKEKATVGGRIYIAVEKAGDIPRIGEGIFKGLWVNGHGHIKPSKAGTALVRSTIDTAVWQPERLDFVKPAILGEGVMREEIKPIWWHGGLLPELVSDVLPDVSETYHSLVEEKKLEAESELKGARESYVDRVVAQKAEKLREDGLKEKDVKVLVSTLKRTYSNATQYHNLDSHFVIYLSSDLLDYVKIGDILKNPEKFNGRTCCDPLEPERTFGKAKIFTNSIPVINSFLHGGCRYRMVSQARIPVPELPENTVADNVRKVVGLMKSCFPGQFYKVNNQLSCVSDEGSLIQMTQTQLTLAVSERLDFQRQKRGKDVVIPMPKDISGHIVESAGDSGVVNLPSITQVVNAPFLIPRSGEIIREFGFHHHTKTFLHSDGIFPEETNIRDKDHALRVASQLIEPYVDFNLYNGESLKNFHDAMVLNLILSAILRPSIVCPIYLFTASRAGAGKTYMMRCLIAEMGERANFLGWTEREEEADKRLAAWCQHKPSYIAIDNFDHVFGGGMLEALADKPLDEFVSLRLLGGNDAVSMANNALIVASGINIRPKSEAMARRSLSIRIEPDNDEDASWRGKKMQLPYSPVEYILSKYRERHMLGLSLAKWGVEQGFEGMEESFNALPDYDKVIRRLVFALYGVDIASEIFEDTKEVGMENDLHSPKGRLFYLTWLMIRSYVRSGGDSYVIKSGNFKCIDVSEDKFESMSDLPDFMLINTEGHEFTIKTLKEFIRFNNNLDTKHFDEVLKNTKGIASAGHFNGLKYEKAKVSVKGNFWKLKGKPHQHVSLFRDFNSFMGG